MLEFRNIRKNYGSVQALSSVDMTVQKGSVYGLAGTNGAGKTTLLKIAAGIYRSSGGSVQVFEQTPHDNPLVKRRIQFMSDIPWFVSGQTLTEATALYSRLYPTWNSERFRVLVDGFGLVCSKPVDRFSKGVQRQAAFCLALSAMPDLMLLDEPLDGLDPVVRQVVKKMLIQDVAEREMTVVISSHNLRELEDLCDTVGIIHKGTMVVEKDLDQLKNNVYKVQVAFSGSVPHVPQDICVLNTEQRGSVIQLIVRGNREETLNRIRSLNPVILDVLPLTLDEIFIHEMEGLGYEINDIIL